MACNGIPYTVLFRDTESLMVIKIFFRPGQNFCVILSGRNLDNAFNAILRMSNEQDFYYIWFQCNDTRGPI